MRGDGLSVSHRRGYVIADPKREASPAQAALQAAEAIAKGLSGGPIALARRRRAVPGCQGRPLAARDPADRRKGSASGAAKSKQLGLEVFGYAFDGDGRVLDTVTVTPHVDLAAVRPVLEAKGFQVITSFAVPEGPVDLRFLVRETVVAARGLAAAAARDAGLRRRSASCSRRPWRMDDPRTRLVVPAPSRGLPALEIPFRLADAPFTAEPLPALANGSRRDVCVMAWGGAARDGGEPAYEIEAQLVDAAGGARELRLAGPARVVPDADGIERYVLGLAPAGFAAGRYLLRLDFVDPVSGEKARSESSRPGRVTAT